jgi:hypothetical protein
MESRVFRFFAAIAHADALAKKLVDHKRRGGPDDPIAQDISAPGRLSGRPRADMCALEDVLLRVSALVEAHQEVAEMDLNP